VTDRLPYDAERIKGWRHDPVSFVTDPIIYGATPDPFQLEALRALVESPTGEPQMWGQHRIALPACAGPGKSAFLAWAGQWAMAVFGDNARHPKGVAISIDKENLRDNLWAEMSIWRNRSPYLTEAFDITSTRYFAKEFPDSWFISARAWPKRADDTAIGRTLSGLHASWVIALCDESAEMPINLMKTAEQMFSTMEYGCIAQSGNCTSRLGMLYAAITEFADEWRRILITGDPEDPNRSPRVDIDWARKWIKKLGREDPWVQAFILGEFPDVALSTLLTEDDVKEAMTRHVRDDELRGHPKILGVDVAREGLDKCAMASRQGRGCLEIPWRRNLDSIEGAGWVVERWNRWNADACFYDHTGGFGAGWGDQMRVLHKEPVGIVFNGKPTDMRYGNIRAEMWFKMAKWVKDGGAIPPDCEELVKELSVPRYYFKDDRLMLESKDQIRVSLGRSPDLADGLALTFAYDVDALDGPLEDIAKQDEALAEMLLQNRGARERGMQAETGANPYYEL